MAHRFYMSLQGVGDWNKFLKEADAQFAPYRKYLETAKKAADNQPLALAWREPTADEMDVLRERSRKPTGHKHRNSGPTQKRRDRHEPSPPREGGSWVILEACADRPEVPEATFDEFLEAKTVHEQGVVRGRWQPSAGIDVLGSDREARALLLARLPVRMPEASPAKGAVMQAGDNAGERVLCLRPNTYTLECQINALALLEDQPTPRLAPLMRLASTQPTWGRVEHVEVPESGWAILNKPDRDGTTEQRRFVEMALGTPDFALLEGPPGSGKTTAICELIVQLARAGKRVLLVASTHVAVDNVLERLLTWQDNSAEKIVLPVRIGEEDKVSVESIKPWLLGNLRRTWRDELRDHLDKPASKEGPGANARTMLGRVLQEEGKESSLVRLILNAANLVCGTTIGILKHPAIDPRTRSDAGSEPFDVLILDEASKTTFTEFLVPAVHAARWVVVGDRRQLSPFVDEEDFAQNLRTMLRPEDAQAVLHPFLATRGPHLAKQSLVAVTSREAADVLMGECAARGVTAVNLDAADRTAPCLGLLHAQVVVGTASAIAAWEGRLPGDLELVAGAVPDLDAWEAHRDALHTDRDAEPTTWEEQVAWRQVRAHELRQNPQELGRLERDLKDLLPQAPSKAFSQTTRGREVRGVLQTPQDAFKEKMDNVRRVAMPSILEILQVGAGERPEWGLRQTPLTVGLARVGCVGRNVSLSFQHRMHPDISRFPREQFYLKDGLLRDGRDMASRRSWGFKPGHTRASWLNVQPGRRLKSNSTPKNSNPAEALVLMQELQEFLEWARHNPLPDKPWEVAVLTFYRGQEKHLCGLLRAASGERGNTRNFNFHGGHVHVALCTVDRFQGHEADVVFLSFVKSGTVGFLNSPNRLNVGLTRARYQLVLVGDRSWMTSERCRSDLLRSLGNSPHYSHNIAWEQP